MNPGVVRPLIKLTQTQDGLWTEVLSLNAAHQHQNV